MAISAPRNYVKEARRRVGPKRERIHEIVERLARAHPDATIALRFRDPVELLVSVMLSAQTTDVRVNMVTDKLFEKYRTAADYAGADPAEIEADIRPTGFYRNKARSLQGMARALLDEHGGEVPRTMAGLVSLPGVGCMGARGHAVHRRRGRRAVPRPEQPAGDAQRDHP